MTGLYGFYRVFCLAYIDPCDTGGEAKETALLKCMKEEFYRKI